MDPTFNPFDSPVGTSTFQSAAATARRVPRFAGNPLVPATGRSQAQGEPGHAWCAGRPGNGR